MGIEDVMQNPQGSYQTAPDQSQDPNNNGDMKAALLRALIQKLKGGQDASQQPQEIPPMPQLPPTGAAQDAAKTAANPPEPELPSLRPDQVKLDPTKTEQILAAMGQGPRPPVNPDLHGWKHVLDVIAHVVPGPSNSMEAQEAQSNFDLSKAEKIRQMQKDAEEQQDRLLQRSDSLTKSYNEEKAEKDRIKQEQENAAQTKAYETGQLGIRQQEANQTGTRDTETARHNKAEEQGQASEREIKRQQLQDSMSQISAPAQAVLTASTPVHDQIHDLMSQFESMKNDNTPGKFAMDRAKYALGIQSDIGHAADTISQLELDKIVGGARVLKGSSRAIQALRMAMVHMPNIWKDSPQLIYSKLNNLDKALTQIEQDAVTFGHKKQSVDDVQSNLPGLYSSGKGGSTTNGSPSDSNAITHTYDPNSGKAIPVPGVQ